MRHNVFHVHSIISELNKGYKSEIVAADIRRREILQQDRLVLNIRKNLLKKLFDLLGKMDAEKYNSFYDEFGPVLKEGG